MDYPFEYVERVWKYPSFERSEIEKWQSMDKSKDVDSATDIGGRSEEEDPRRAPEGIPIDEKQKQLRAEIEKLEKEMKTNWRMRNAASTSTCTSSDSLGGDSFFETTDSDRYDRIFTSQLDIEAMAARRFKIMQQCYCTDSDCESRVNISEDSSESTSSCPSEIEDKGTAKREVEVVEMTSKDEPSVSSGLSASESDAGIDLEEELELLERILEEKLGMKRTDGVSEDESMDSASDGGKEQQTMKPPPQSPRQPKSISKREKTKQKEELKIEKPRMERSRMQDANKRRQQERTMQPSTALPRSSNNSGRSPRMGVSPNGGKSDGKPAGSTSSSLSSDLYTDSDSSDVVHISSSATDEDDIDWNNPKNFKWDSDDLHARSATDSELERVVQSLEMTARIVDPIFNVNTIVNNSLEKQKLLSFAPLFPDTLDTPRKKYTMMEELISAKVFDTKHYWLVQQLKSGHMFTAKIVSRKHPDHVQMQKDLNNERKILQELLPELPDPTHIVRIEDMGYNEDLKYIIVEDLGINLYTLFQEYGCIIHSSSALFLITHFTFNAIKELHRFNIVHANISPSAFSVQIDPFNVKIADYSRAMKKGKGPLDTNNGFKLDNFSPRAFHRMDMQFDAFVDFESWVYTMIYLCGKRALPWIRDKDSMLMLKEAFMDDPCELGLLPRHLVDFVYQGCAEAVPIAACYLADDNIQYKEFIKRMNRAFSVDAMLYADTDRPLLFHLRDKERERKKCDEYEAQLDEGHWDPADESDSSDGMRTDNEKDVYGAMWGQFGIDLEQDEENFEAIAGELQQEPISPLIGISPGISPHSKSPMQPTQASVMAKTLRVNQTEARSPNTVTPKTIAKIESEERRKSERQRRGEGNEEVDPSDDSSSFSTSSNTDSSRDSYSSWTTSSSEHSENVRKYKWDRMAMKKRAEPVEFVDAMNEREETDFEIYELLVQEWLKGCNEISSDSDTEDTAVSEQEKQSEEVAITGTEALSPIVKTEARSGITARNLL